MKCSDLERLEEIESLVNLNPDHPASRHIRELISMVRQKQKIIVEEKELIRHLESKFMEVKKIVW